MQQEGIAALLGGAAAMLAGAFGITLFVADRREISPTVRALATACPIAAAVLVSRLLHREEIAIGIIFGTSVAMLSTVVGSICSVAPVGPAPGRWRRLWSFAIAATFIAFLAGFTGVVSWIGALVLAAEGVLMLWLWRDAAAEYRDHMTEVPAPPPESAAARLHPVAALLLGGGYTLLAAGGAYLATKGAVQFSAIRGNVPTGTLAATMLSIVLVMPSMHSGRRLATAGLSWVPMTAQTGVVLINLCGLLPLLALSPYCVSHLPTVSQWFPPTLDWGDPPPQPLAFPLAIWRIDALLLVILSVLYLPVSMGRWNLGREEGMLLVIAYFVYLIAVAAAGVRG